jgi:hypothetical protein
MLCLRASAVLYAEEEKEVEASLAAARVNAFIVKSFASTRYPRASIETDP